MSRMGHLALMMEERDVVITGTPKSATEIAVRHIFKGDVDSILHVPSSRQLTVGTLSVIGLDRDGNGGFVVTDVMITGDR
jgi:hypothetical protein